MRNEFFDFVSSELKELETRDVDQLFECHRDNLMEMGFTMSDSQDDSLYSEIERAVQGE